MRPGTKRTGMVKRPGRPRYDLSARFEQAVRQLPGGQRRWLLDRLRATEAGKRERDFWVLDPASGRWRRL